MMEMDDTEENDMSLATKEVNDFIGVQQPKMNNFWSGTLKMCYIKQNIHIVFAMDAVVKFLLYCRKYKAFSWI